MDVSWLFALIAFAFGIALGYVGAGIKTVWRLLQIVGNDAAWEEECREVRRILIEEAPPYLRGR